MRNKFELRNSCVSEVALLSTADARAALLARQESRRMCVASVRGGQLFMRTPPFAGFGTIPEYPAAIFDRGWGGRSAAIGGSQHVLFLVWAGQPLRSERLSQGLTRGCAINPYAARFTLG